MKDLSVYIAGSGHLGTELRDGLRKYVSRVYISTRQKTGYIQGDSFKFGEVNPATSDKTVGIIATTQDGLETALSNFEYNGMRTIVCSTGNQVSGLIENRDIPILQAPNLALPPVSLMKVFSDFEDFGGMTMRIKESHQAGKQDPSGTAMKIIKGFVDKGGKCEVDRSKEYNALNGISDLGGLTTYRGDASINMGVSRDYIQGHAYHTYEVSGQGEKYEQFAGQIEAWNKKYKGVKYTGFASTFKMEDGKIIFSHNIDGRAIYADGVRELLPKFLEKDTGVYQVSDLL